MVLKFLSKQTQKLVLILLALDIFSSTMNRLAKFRSLCCVHLTFLHFKKEKSYPFPRCLIRKTPDTRINPRINATFIMGTSWEMIEEWMRWPESAGSRSTSRHPITVGRRVARLEGNLGHPSWGWIQWWPRCQNRSNFLLRSMDFSDRAGNSDAWV